MEQFGYNIYGQVEANPLPCQSRGGMKAEKVVLFSELVTEHLQFLQSFNGHAPMCEVGVGTDERCTSKSINFYKRPCGHGVAVCAKHDPQLQHVEETSPYPSEKRLKTCGQKKTSRSQHAAARV